MSNFQDDKLIIERLDMFHPGRHKCICCGQDIIYDNTRVSRNGVITGTSFQTKKIIDGDTFYLRVCKKCLTSKFPDIKNKSRVFNVLSQCTKYAFQVTDEKFIKGRKMYAVSKDHMISKYGEEEGIRRWYRYINRQTEVNTFEYKEKIYGWNKEQFDEYNKLRASTKNNFIRKYGENIGLQKWNDYVNKQSITKSKDYIISKYGEEYWYKLCQRKNNTIEVYKSKYGEVEGVLKYKEYLHNKRTGYSKISQTFFKELDSYISKYYETYYAENGGEYIIMRDPIIYLDYYIPKLKLNIEFNGDRWHGNPKLFSKDDKCLPYKSDKTAADLWGADNNRYELLRREYGINVIVVWEYDYTHHNIDIKQFIQDVLKIKIF